MRVILLGPQRRPTVDAVARSLDLDGPVATIADDAAGPAQADTAPPAAGPGYSMSGGLVARLRTLGLGLAFTSYQSGLLYLIGRNPTSGGLNVHQTPIEEFDWCKEDLVLEVEGLDCFDS